MKSKFKISSRIWIDAGQEPFLAEGRMELLQQIIQERSIRKAALNMNMSYSKAWGLIKSLNENSSQPVVVKTAGGKDGGCTEVTKFGMKLMNNFSQLQKRHKEMLQKEFGKYQWT